MGPNADHRGRRCGDSERWRSGHPTPVDVLPWRTANRWIIDLATVGDLPWTVVLDVATRWSMWTPRMGLAAWPAEIHGSIQ